jgi:uncharacterized radical SAM superfamily protein
MKRIKVVNLTRTVPVSVTGTACALHCKHCNAHYLQHMMAINDVKISHETKSILVSGGSTPDGRVPVLEHLDKIKELKAKGYKLNFHVGLVDEKEACEISKIADAISFDFVGDDETIKYVYNLDKKVSDYVRTFEVLRKYTTNVYPHVTVGLNCGKITHEFKAIDILSKYPQKKVVFIVFIPTNGTFFENCPVPSTKDVESVFAYARRKFDCDLNLGCMYPKGKYRDEIAMAAIRSNFNVITQPSKKVVEYLKEEEYFIEYSDECCVL